MHEHNQAESVADSTLERVAHVMAHVREGGAGTDYCDRDFVSDESRGVEGQVLHLIHDVLTPEEVAAIGDALGLGEDGRPYFLGDYVDSDPEALGWVADAIEENTPYYWEDGDVFRRVDCEMVDEYGEFNLGEDDLSIEAMRDENGDVAHLRVAWTLGGPNVWLIRDWGEDRIEVYWGGKATRYGREVTELLDAYTELLSY